MHNPHFAKGMHHATPSPQTGEYPSLAKTIPNAPITLSPPPTVVHRMMDAFSRYGSHVTPACRESVESMFRRGAFHACLDLLGREISDDSGHHSSALLQALRGIAISALEQRLGDLMQLATPGPGNSPFEASYARILALAADHPSIDTLVHRAGPDRLQTLELVVKLVHHRWLTLEPARASQRAR